eukprot:gene755-4047_t
MSSSSQTHGTGSSRTKNISAASNHGRKPRDFTHLLSTIPDRINSPHAGSDDEEKDTELDQQRHEQEAMKQMMGFGAFGQSTSTSSRHNEENTSKEHNNTTHIPQAEAVSQKESRSTLNDDGHTSNEEDEEEKDLQSMAGSDNTEGPLGIPITHEVTLKHGTKAISTITLDPSGSRLITGSFDYDLRFWDFNSMDVRLQSFRTITPQDGNTGDCFLVGTGSPLYKILDRDGSNIIESVRGDQYIYDRKRTHAHVTCVSCACWHPRRRELYITGSFDGTIRLWDMDDMGKKTLQTGLCRHKGKYIAVNSTHFNREGTIIVAGCDDGYIFTFFSSEKAIRQREYIQGHASGSHVTCVRFSVKGRTFISRATDGTIKCWDMYKMTTPTLQADNLPCHFSWVLRFQFIRRQLSAECIFSPDERFVLTGTSFEKDTEPGMLVILKTKTFERVQQIGVGPRGVISLLWHLKLNQILAGCSDGCIKVFFNPLKSAKGAKLCASRAPRKEDPLDQFFLQALSTAQVGVSWGDEVRELRRTAKSRQEKARKDPVKSKKPEEPVKSDRGGKEDGSWDSAPLYRNTSPAEQHMYDCLKNYI